MPIYNVSTEIHFSAFLTSLVYFRQSNPLSVTGKKTTTGPKNKKEGKPAILKNYDDKTKSSNTNSLLFKVLPSAEHSFINKNNYSHGWCDSIDWV